MKDTLYDVMSGKSLKRPRRRRYPIWRIRWVGTLLLASALMIVLLVFLVGRRSLFVEVESSLALIALVLFVFLATGLYHGARLKWEPLAPFGMYKHRKSSWLDGLDVGITNVVLVADGGCLGAILSLLAGLLLIIVLGALLYFVVPFIWAGILVLMTGIFWVLNRALRVVFARGRECRGNLPRSMFYALVYTLGYTGWLFLLIYVGHLCLLARA